jgi:predicted RNA binding protein YcfA (HicA-like mRNA interferase family)
VGSAEKLLQKFVNRTLKKAELETLLSRLEFRRFGGKGSHEVWGRKDFPDLHIVIATHTKEVPTYQLEQIEVSLKKRGFL